MSISKKLVDGLENETSTNFVDEVGVNVPDHDANNAEPEFGTAHPL